MGLDQPHGPFNGPVGLNQPGKPPTDLDRLDDPSGQWTSVRAAGCLRQGEMTRPSGCGMWPKFLDADPMVLTGHDFTVTAVEFSPEATLASSSWDKTVRLWDLSNPGSEPVVLRDHAYGVASIAFSPDGSTLAAGISLPDGVTLAEAGQGLAIRLWIPRTEILSDMVCGTVWRNLAMEEWRRFVGEDVPYVRTCPNLPPAQGAPVDFEPVVELAIATNDVFLNNDVCWFGSSRASPRSSVQPATVLSSWILLVARTMTAEG